MKRTFGIFTIMSLLMVTLLIACSSNDTVKTTEKEKDNNTEQIAVQDDSPSEDTDSNKETKEKVGESDAGENTVGQSIFYEDDITINHMGEKEMLFANEEINETETLNDVEVTFEGYQFTQFVPNENYESDFDIFDEGIVLFTTKFHFKNNRDDEIYVGIMWDVITVNDGEGDAGSPVISIRTELDKEENILEPGESTIAYQFTALAEERYEAIKDEQLSIEFGPIYQLDSTGNSQPITEEKIIFDLPR